MIAVARNVSRAAVGLSALLFATAASAQLAPNEQSARAMRLERFVVPEFPPFLRQSGVLQGTVVVALGRDAADRVGDMLVLESTDPRFTDAALDAIREWRFSARAPSSAAAEIDVPVVRFLFTTGAISVVPLTPTTGRSSSRRSIRAESPVELPNFSHLDRVPKALHAPAPEFPAALRTRSQGGTAVVKYFVDPDGRVRLPVVVSAPEPAFGAAALDALRQWRFEPPRIDGKPVVVLERHSFQFSAPAP